MQELCFMTNVSGEQWAAWVQAVGSIGAIGGSFWLARKFQLDELRRQELANKAQSDLASLVQMAEVKRIADGEARLNVQRCGLATQVMRDMHRVLEGVSDKHADLVLNAQEIVPIESSLAVPTSILAQIPLLEIPDQKVVSSIARVLTLLRYTVDAGKYGPPRTVRKNFAEVLDYIADAIDECDRYKAVVEGQLANKPAH